MLLLSLPLAGCANSDRSLMDARAEASGAAKTSTYLPLGDTPQQRDTQTMTADERSKLKKALSAVRDRQAAAVKARDKNGK